MAKVSKEYKEKISDIIKNVESVLDEKSFVDEEGVRRHNDSALNAYKADKISEILSVNEDFLVENESAYADIRANLVEKYGPVFEAGWDAYTSNRAEAVNQTELAKRDARIAELEDLLAAAVARAENYDEKLKLNETLKSDLDAAEELVVEAEQKAAEANRRADEAKQGKEQAEQTNLMLREKIQELKNNQEDKQDEDVEELKKKNRALGGGLIAVGAIATAMTVAAIVALANSGKTKVVQPVFDNDENAVTIDYMGRVAAEQDLVYLNDFKFDDNNYIIINGKTIKTNADYKEVFDDIKNPETDVIYRVESKYIDEEDMQNFAYEFTKLLMQHDTYLDVVIHDYAKANDVAMNDFTFDEKGNMKIAQRIIATSAEGQQVVVEIAQDGAARVIVEGRYFKDAEAKQAFITETMNLLVKERDANKTAEDDKQEAVKALNDALDEIGEAGYTYAYVADENGNVEIEVAGEKVSVNVVNPENLDSVISSTTTEDVQAKYAVLVATIDKLDKELETAQAQNETDKSTIKNLEAAIDKLDKELKTAQAQNDELDKELETAQAQNEKDKSTIKDLTEKLSGRISANEQGTAQSTNDLDPTMVSDEDPNKTPETLRDDGFQNGADAPIVVTPTNQGENAENTDATSDKTNNTASSGFVPGADAPIVKQTSETTSDENSNEQEEKDEVPTSFGF